MEKSKGKLGPMIPKDKLKELEASIVPLSKEESEEFDKLAAWAWDCPRTGNGIYDMESVVDKNGNLQILGALVPKPPILHGLKNGPGFGFCVLKDENKTELYSLIWYVGNLNKPKIVATINEKLVTEDEVEGFLKEYGLLKDAEDKEKTNHERL